MGFVLDDISHRGPGFRYLPAAALCWFSQREHRILLRVGTPPSWAHRRGIAGKMARVAQRARVVSSEQDGMRGGTFLSATRRVRFVRSGERAPINTHAEPPRRGAQGLRSASRTLQKDGAEQGGKLFARAGFSAFFVPFTAAKAFSFVATNCTFFRAFCIIRCTFYIET